MEAFFTFDEVPICFEASEGVKRGRGNGSVTGRMLELLFDGSGATLFEPDPPDLIATFPCIKARREEMDGGKKESLDGLDGLGEPR